MKNNIISLITFSSKENNCILNPKGLPLLFIIISFCLLLAPEKTFAVVTWTGNGQDNNWSTPANWSNSTLPGVNDIVQFNGTITKNCNINAIININGLRLESNWAATITQLSGYSITIGSGGFIQAGGGFTGSSSITDGITINGDFSLSGGSFTAPKGILLINGQAGINNTGNFTITGGIFTHNSGTVKFNHYPPHGSYSSATIAINLPSTNQLAFGSLWFHNSTSGCSDPSASQYYSLSNDTLIVTGTYIQSGNGACNDKYYSYVNSGVIFAKDSIKGLAYAKGGSATIVVNGIKSQYYSSTGGLLPGLIVNTTYSLSAASGTTDLHVCDFKLRQGNFSAPTGILYISGQWGVNNTGNFTDSGGTFTHNNGTVKFDHCPNYGASQTSTILINLPSSHTLTFGSLWFHNPNTDYDAGGSYQYYSLSSDTLIVTKTFTQSGIAGGRGTYQHYSYVNSGVIFAKDSIKALAYANGGTANIIVNGNKAQFYSSTGGLLPSLILNNTCSLSYAAGTTDLHVSDLTLTQGNFSAPTGILYISGQWGVNNTGNFTVTGGNFKHNYGIIKFDHGPNYGGYHNSTILINKPSSHTLMIGSLWFHNPNTDYDAGGSYQYYSLSSDTLIVTGTLSQSGIAGGGGTYQHYSYVNSGVIFAKDSIKALAYANGGTANIIVNGNKAQYYSSTGGLLPDLFINTSGSLSPAIGTMDLHLRNLTLTGGTFSAPVGPNGILYISGQLGANNTGNFTVNGGTFTHNNGTVKFDHRPNNGSSQTSTILVNQSSSRSLTLGSLWFHNPNTDYDAGGSYQYYSLSADTLVVTGTLTQSGTAGGGGTNQHYSYVNSGVISAQGNVAFSTYANGGNASMIFTGTAATQTLTYAGSTMLSGAWIVNKPSGSIVLGSNITFPGKLRILSGVFLQGGTNTVTIQDSLIIGSLGSFANIGKGSLTLGGPVYNNGGIVINSNGPNCGDAQSILLRSSVSGTRRIWSGNGKFMILDADIKDMGGAIPIAAYNSINSGNNSSSWDIVSTCIGMENEDKIYVQEGNIGAMPNGTYASPYHSIQDAMNNMPVDYVVRPYTILLLAKSNNTAFVNGFDASQFTYNFTKGNPLKICSNDMSNRVTFQKTGVIFNLSHLKNVIIEGIIFKGKSTNECIAIKGAPKNAGGGTDNIIISKCEFINERVNRLSGIVGLGDSLLVENCVFFSSYNEINDNWMPIKCIEEGFSGGKYYTVVNNTAVCGSSDGIDVGGWSYFLIMNDLTGSKVVNNFVKSSKYFSEKGFAISGTGTLEINEGNYFYHTIDSTDSIDPNVNGLGKPMSINSPLVDKAHSFEFTPMDDYNGKYCVTSKRDIGAYELGGFNFKGGACYSVDASGNTVAELDKDGKVLSTNIYGMGMVGKEIYQQNALSNRLFYIKNHLGSTMKVVDGSAQTIATLNYFSSGEKYDEVSGNLGGAGVGETFTGNRFMSAGEGSEGLGINNQGIGLYAMGARSYDPQLGIFLSQDPMGQFIDAYSYAGGNPMNFIDPSGLFANDWDHTPTTAEIQDREAQNQFNRRVADYNELMAYNAFVLGEKTAWASEQYGTRMTRGTDGMKDRYYSEIGGNSYALWTGAQENLKLGITGSHTERDAWDATWGSGSLENMMSQAMTYTREITPEIDFATQVMMAEVAKINAEGAYQSPTLALGSMSFDLPGISMSDPFASGGVASNMLGAASSGGNDALWLAGRINLFEGLASAGRLSQADCKWAVEFMWTGKTQSIYASSESYLFGGQKQPLNYTMAMATPNKWSNAPGSGSQIVRWAGHTGIRLGDNVYHYNGNRLTESFYDVNKMAGGGAKYYPINIGF